MPGARPGHLFGKVDHRQVNIFVEYDRLSPLRAAGVFPDLKKLKLLWYIQSDNILVSTIMPWNFSYFAEDLRLQ